MSTSRLHPAWMVRRAQAHSGPRHGLARLLDAMRGAVGKPFGKSLTPDSDELAFPSSEALLRAILDSALDGIIVMDHRGKILEFNRGAEQIFQYQRDEVIGEDLAELLLPPSTRADFRRRLARYLATERASVLGRRIELNALRADGVEFRAEAAFTLVGLSGPPLFQAHVRDITVRKRREEQDRVLAEASLAMSASLDPHPTLRELAQLAVPRLADWCVVRLMGEEGTTESLGVAHFDPGKGKQVEEIEHRYPPRPEDRHGAYPVVATGRSALYSEIPDSLLAEAARDAEHLELLRGLGARSAMIAPLTARGRTLGTVTFVA
ncbi:MAG: PAS domain S-box protein, partial [Actinomycetota bacterium]|nr:PAS domain S-box protein [Actinomycetota bacterium]